MGAYISKIKQCFNAKPLACHFYMKSKILVDFHIFISVPLSFVLVKHQTKASKQGVRIRFFSGASIEDLFSYLKPLLQRVPKEMDLQVSANTSINEGNFNQI